MDEVLAEFPPDEAPEPPAADDAPRIAVVGRPNVGKSTLVNRLLGEDRMIVYDEPGTTRDAIEVPFERAGRRYILIDTAGVRRKGRVFEAVEKFSVVKTLQAIDRRQRRRSSWSTRPKASSEQDAHLAGFILERGRAMVVAVEQVGWSRRVRPRARAPHPRAQARVPRLRAPALRVGAARGGARTPAGVGGRGLSRLRWHRLPTPKLTRALIDAVARQAPPRAGLFRPKLRYAHQGGVNPPIIVIHGDRARPRYRTSYRRYLEGVFRKAFGLRRHADAHRVQDRTKSLCATETLSLRRSAAPACAPAMARMEGNRLK